LVFWEQSVRVFQKAKPFVDKNVNVRIWRASDSIDETTLKKLLFFKQINRWSYQVRQNNKMFNT